MKKEYRNVTITATISVSIEEEMKYDEVFSKALETFKGMSNSELLEIGKFTCGKLREDAPAVFALVDKEYGIEGYAKNNDCFVFRLTCEPEEEMVVDFSGSDIEFECVLGSDMCYVNGGGQKGPNIECEGKTDMEIATEILIEREGF